MAPIQSIIIVGAGPAGLLLALLLAKSGIPNLRPVAFFEFERAGILEDVRAAAYETRSAAWRDQADGGKVLFEMKGAGLLALMSNSLVAITQKHLAADKSADVQILWRHKVVDVGQDEHHAWVDVEGPDQSAARMEADYVVGCDGGTSTVRRSLFGEKAMPGFTWDDTLVAVDVRYDLHAYDMADSNLFMHPHDSWLVYRPSKDELLWRVIYSEDGGLSDDEIVRRQPERLQSLLPGNPTRDQCEVLRVQPYRIHQRIVDKMRLGKVVLASDAAHLCCPYGALGLNGGIADVGSLRDCLVAIHEDKADDDILDVYSDVRREKWKTIIDPRSQGTKKFLFSSPKDVIPNHPIYQMARKLEENPEMATKMGPDLFPPVRLLPALSLRNLDVCGRHPIKIINA